MVPASSDEALLDRLERWQNIGHGLVTTLPILLSAGREAVRLAQGGVADEGTVLDWESRTFPRLSEAVLESLGHPLELESTVQPLRRDERLLVFGNHPSNSFLFPWYEVVRPFVPRNSIVAKGELAPGTAKGLKGRMESFLVGEPLRALGKDLFIERDNRESALQAVCDYLDTKFPLGRGVIVFPDGHRFTQKYLDKDLKRFEPRYPGLSTWLTHSCFPKSGSTWTIQRWLSEREQKNGESFRSIDVTTIEPQRLGERGAFFHMILEDITDEIRECVTREDFENLLVRRWGMKNDLYRAR